MPKQAQGAETCVLRKRASKSRGWKGAARAGGTLIGLGGFYSQMAKTLRFPVTLWKLQIQPSFPQG